MTRRTTEEPVKIVSCPQCRKSVPWTPDSRFRPFCSERCRLIDLGAWAEGSHYIPGDSGYADDGSAGDGSSGEEQG